MTAETEVGRAAVAWLAHLGFEVYQEVAVLGRVIDVVGTLGPIVATIECKTTLSLDVIEQAEHWTRHAHYSWVAVPDGVRSGRWFAERVCRHFEIGLLYVDGRHSARDLAATVTERVHPDLHRRVDVTTIRGSLHERQKTEAPAGTAGGGHWTPFRQTCEDLAAIVRTEPGILLREAIAKIKHHYASPVSARSSLKTWIEKGRVRGVELRTEGRALRLFPR